MIQEASPIFIVGNSRSGTTMLMRILDRHDQLHTLNEPHFFERHWNGDKAMRPADATALLTKMVSHQRDGFFAPSNVAYEQECETAITRTEASQLSALGVYRLFLAHETDRNGKQIPCDKTPQNVFYIKEILECFPNARIIQMVRDPRSVLASQKNKWRRKNLGSDTMPAHEVRRLRINYHPLTMCQLWNAALGAGEAYREHPQVYSVRYEDLLEDPEQTVATICRFCGLEFQEDMLQIPVASSSIRPDAKGAKGIRRASKQAWRQYLEAHEIAIVQHFCKRHMATWGYAPVLLEMSLLSYLLSLLSYPFKLALALVFNFSRIRNLKDTILRRVSHFANTRINTYEPSKS